MPTRMAYPGSNGDRTYPSGNGVRVKFKLEVNVTDAELQDIADRSRRRSRADLIVANTLEGMQDWAMLGDRSGPLVRIERPRLAARLIDKVQQLQQRLDEQRTAHNLDRSLLMFPVAGRDSVRCTDPRDVLFARPKAQKFQRSHSMLVSVPIRRRISQ